jgi:hypothetical protein
MEGKCQVVERDLTFSRFLDASGGHGHDHGDHDETNAACRTRDGEVDDGHTHDGDDHDHHGHHHRNLGHASDVFLKMSAKCKPKEWTSYIKNYSATDEGTHIYVFSDGTTTARVRAEIVRDGASFKNAKVVGHLHAGACSAPGKHWWNDEHEELHFSFNTTDNGHTEAETCRDVAVDETAKSIVLHEADDNAVVGMGAKKLCCDLVWEEHDSGVTSDAPVATPIHAVAAGATLVVAALQLIL